MSSSAYSVTGMKPSTSLHSDANFELQFHILCKYRAAVQRRLELQSLAMSCHDCCCCCCSFLTRCHDAEDLPGNTKIWILELPTTRERQRTAAKSSVKHGADTRCTRACGRTPGRTRSFFPGKVLNVQCENFCCLSSLPHPLTAQVHQRTLERRLSASEEPTVALCICFFN